MRPYGFIEDRWYGILKEYYIDVDYNPVNRRSKGMMDAKQIYHYSYLSFKGNLRLW